MGSLGVGGSVTSIGLGIDIGIGGEVAMAAVEQCSLIKAGLMTKTFYTLSHGNDYSFALSSVSTDKE